MSNVLYTHAPLRYNTVTHMTLFPIAAFSDNYIWVLHDAQSALVVDPGEEQGVLDWLDHKGIVLDTILVTHHHADHTGGVAALREATGAQVIGPAFETMPEPLRRVQGGDRIQALGLDFEVLDVPGHTAGHIAFFAADADPAPLLFCGDTLFSAGCGRLFEGTPDQMLNSLTALASLPDQTRVCCTHEYTLSNLRFARTVDPGNATLANHARFCEQQRERNLPTLPSTIGLEKQINPFLRSHESALLQAATAHDPATSNEAVSVFATLRAWKNEFR